MIFTKKIKRTEEEGLSFWEHLEELRSILIKCVIYVTIGFIISFFFKNFIFDVIILGPTKPYFITNRAFCYIASLWNMPELCLNQIPVKLMSINMTSQFAVHINISLISGFIIAMPLILYQIWKFLKPALLPKEKKYISKAVFASSILFFIGVLFSYYILVPLTVHFFSNYQVSPVVENRINITSFISSITSVIFFTGLIFELPVITYFLVKTGILKAETLIKARKYIIILILFISAIITPPDILSQIIVSIPIFALYELSIFIAKKQH
ncbi:MAG: twin-arginine translocase subunit TatC [Bacteroidales bacterium]|nr:twin-arginine translocase subunit TatC [Bacteroidales bacterium]